MTEAEWWAATEPPVSWLFFDAWATDRKLRLHAVACCDRIRGLVNDPDYLDCLDVAEAFADSLTSEALRDRASRYAWDKAMLRQPKRPPEVASAQSACLAAAGAVDPRRSREEYPDYDPNFCHVSKSVVRAVAGPDGRHSWALRNAEYLRQVHLLHDIFGPLPFRDVVIAPEWLTSDVAALAWGTYDEKAFDRLPILADALQDAGCDIDELLTHLRSDGPHVRGCWALDLILGNPWREG